MAKLEIPNNWVSVSTIICAFAAIATLYLTIYNLISLGISSRIDKKINDPAYIRKVAAEIMPSIIFDEQGKILYDSGGLKYIDNIEINDIGNRMNPKIELIITAKQYLQSAPIIEPLDLFYKITPIRGKKYEWIYHLVQVGILDANAKGMLIRFRLEIIK